MLENKEEQPEYRESAYTAPAEADASTAFQYHSDLVPPSAKRRRKEAHRRKWAKAVICVVLVFLCLALAVSLFLLRYQVLLTRDEGGFGLQIVRRAAAVITPDNAGFEPQEQAVLQNPGQKVGADHLWNGEKLELEAPDKADSLSWSGVYQQWSASVGAVTATDRDGSMTRGSAIVMSEDGFLITGSSLVLYAESIVVDLHGESYPADLVGLDIASGLAVIRIQASGLQAARFGQSDAAGPGEDIAVMGASRIGSIGIYSGVLTSLSQDYSYRGFSMQLFELYMTLGEQCCGAPVVNRFGQVIGIVNTDINERFPDAEGVSYAVPIHAAKGIIDQLLEYGYIPGRPSSGLTVAEIPAAYVLFYKYPSCVYVAAVKESSTAQAAGVQQGDLIISANGITIQSVDQLYAVINGMESGDELTLELFRDGGNLTISFLLMEAASPAD